MPKIPGTKFVGPDGRVVYRPIIILTLIVNGQEARGPGIIDSGADDTLVPFEAVEPLGLDWDALPPAPDGSGAGGGFLIRYCADGVIRWGSDDLMTGFKVAEREKIDVVLLGRGDFFKLYVPTFRWYGAGLPEFDLVEVPPLPDPSAAVPEAVTARRTKKPKPRQGQKRRR